MRHSRVARACRRLWDTIDSVASFDADLTAVETETTERSESNQAPKDGTESEGAMDR